jgi:hypothetical protein
MSTHAETLHQNKNLKIKTVAPFQAKAANLTPNA